MARTHGPRPFPTYAAAVAFGLTCGVAPAHADPIDFVAVYTDSAGTGFHDPVHGPTRKAALEQAMGLWEGVLGAAYAGETIRVEARFTNQGGGPTAAPLATGGPKNFIGVFAPIGGLQPNIAYGYPLYDHLLGASTIFDTDILIEFNADIDGAALGSKDFYYGVDAAPGLDVDFVTLALHEIGHGLNIFPLIESDGGFTFPDPGIYDTFLVDAMGNPLTGMTDPQRLAAVTSGGLFFSGAHANAANGGSPVQLYAPGAFEPGSTAGHLDPTLFAGDLFVPEYTGPNHAISPVARGVLADLGWTVVPEPATLALALLALPITRRRR